MCYLFVYLHFLDHLHVLFSTLRFSLRFVPANHRQLSLPFRAWKSLEKVVVYKAASGKEQNSCKPTGLWLELGSSQYRTSSVIVGGLITEDKLILVLNWVSQKKYLHQVYLYLLRYFSSWHKATVIGTLKKMKNTLSLGLKHAKKD